MRISVRNRLRELYAFRCGYCGVSEQDSGSLLTTDHFQPRSCGGLSTFSNLVYACHTCNEFKGGWWNPSCAERILHPLDDRMGDHFTEEASGQLEARTVTGEFHILRLRLNREPLVRRRHEMQARYAFTKFEGNVLDRLSLLEQEVAEVRDQLRRRDR